MPYSQSYTGSLKDRRARILSHANWRELRGELKHAWETSDTVRQQCHNNAGIMLRNTLPDTPWDTSKKPKLLVIGHGRHGKDTVCDLLKKHNHFTFSSSSWFCAKSVILPAIVQAYEDGTAVSGETPPKYRAIRACFADRHNWRKFWFDSITAFNTPDRSRLAREITAKFDVYGGMRNREELTSSIADKVFDCIVWVDASKRLPPEDASSCTVTMEDADYVIDNNGPEEDLLRHIQDFLYSKFGMLPNV